MTTSPPPPDWSATEPGARAAANALARAVRRALRRPLLVVALALGCALAVAAVRARGTRRFTAQVTLKMTESSVEAGQERVPRDLQKHLLDAALSSRRLGEVVRARGLYRPRADTDMASAIASLREDLELDVSANYLLAERDPGDPPRSARVDVAYTAASAELASAIAHDLADAIVEAEGEQRESEATAASSAVGEGLAALRERYFALSDERRRAQRDDAAVGHRSERSARLLREEDELASRMNDTERQRTRLELITRAEQSGLGTQIDRVYDGVSSRGGSTPQTLGAIAALVFFLALPLSALLVGAFDPRVRGGDDVAAAGLVLLSEIPRRGNARRARRKEV